MNSISNIPPAQNNLNIAAQAQPMQNKETINDKTAVVQTSNEKKVKEDKEKKDQRRKKDQSDNQNASEEKKEEPTFNPISNQNLIIAQEQQSGGKLVTSSKAHKAYKV